MSNYYLTTSIPYVNARPHLGHALEFVQADVVARSHRLRGDDVYFLAGSDDNSLKNVQAAAAAGIGTRAFVDQNADIFQSLLVALSISNDAFIRTADAAHFTGAQKLWSACNPDDIYKKRYQGLYCVGCEQFYTEDELIEGLCPEHRTKPELVEEENYFFKLSNYQDQLAKLIETDEYLVVPGGKKKEILSFIKGGLQDFSISRSVERAKNWGVPVPGDPSQIMYVWFDALSNYITGLGYGDDETLFKKFWPADAHVVGKGIIRFHAVYWPAMLLSARIPLPKSLFVHGYITVNGTKMSKSIGNVIDPLSLAEQYGVDAVRFYFLRHIHPFEDSDFTIDKFRNAYTADLANGIGNLVSRVTAMIANNCAGTLLHPVSIDASFQKHITDYIDQWDFRSALNLIMERVAACDGRIESEKPWALAKTDQATAHAVLTELANEIYNIGLALRPIMPLAANRIIEQVSAAVISKADGLFAKLTV